MNQVDCSLMDQVVVELHNRIKINVS